MQNIRALIAVATILGGTYILLGATQQGSGGGAITTDNSTEGGAFDFQGLAGQIMDAATPAPATNPTALSYAGLDALKRREGFAATPYADHKGYSIGYGHLIKAGENITQVSMQEALDLLAQDVQWATDAVCGAITADIGQSSFDALVSFCYNVGSPAFKKSTLVRRINAGDPAASNEFIRWIYASGKADQGLIARRNSEKNQFESAFA